MLLNLKKYFLNKLFKNMTTIRDQIYNLMEDVFIRNKHDEGIFCFFEDEHVQFKLNVHSDRCVLYRDLLLYITPFDKDNYIDLEFDKYMFSNKISFAQRLHEKLCHIRDMHRNTLELMRENNFEVIDENNKSFEKLNELIEKTKNYDRIDMCNHLLNMLTKMSDE